MIAARFDQFLSRSELIYFSTSSSVCQELFQGFSTVFLAPIQYAALFRTLAYIIIGIRVCQPLFSLFFILFYISYNLC